MGSNTTLTHTKSKHVTRSGGDFTEEHLEKLSVVKQTQSKKNAHGKLTTKDFLESPREEEMKYLEPRFNSHPHQQILYSQLYATGDPFLDNRTVFPSLKNGTRHSKSITPLPIPSHLNIPDMPSPKMLPNIRSCSRLFEVRSSLSDSAPRSKTSPRVGNKSFFE